MNDCDDYQEYFTREDRERQDAVDNEIFNGIKGVLKLVGIDEDQIPWDIETIGIIRDTIIEFAIDNDFISEEYELYP